MKENSVVKGIAIAVGAVVAMAGVNWLEDQEDDKQIHRLKRIVKQQNEQLANQEQIIRLIKNRTDELECILLIPPLTREHSDTEDCKLRFREGSNGQDTGGDSPQPQQGGQ